jgi:serine/threonine-protein kinase PknG
VRTVEIDLRLAAAMIESGDHAGAAKLLDAIEANDRWDWRTAWYRGISELVQGHPAQARGAFMTVYREIPGELAPKLALALAAEWSEQEADAARWYDTVSRTDPSITSASFGLARCRLALGDRAGALNAYERVPDTSSAYLDAQTARIRCLVAANGSALTFDELLDAGAILEDAPVDSETRDRLTVDLLMSALVLAQNGAAPDHRATLLGHRVDERDLRLALERSYRALARRATTRAERIRLVDEANRTRPRTWT